VSAPAAGFVRMRAGTAVHDAPRLAIAIARRWDLAQRATAQRRLVTRVAQRGGTCSESHACNRRRHCEVTGLACTRARLASRCRALRRRPLALSRPDAWEVLGSPREPQRLYVRTPLQRCRPAWSRPPAGAAAPARCRSGSALAATTHLCASSPAAASALRDRRRRTKHNHVQRGPGRHTACDVRCGRRRRPATDGHHTAPRGSTTST